MTNPKNQFTTKEERNNANNLIETTKIWFDDEGYVANLTTIEDKIKVLTLQNSVIIDRIERHRRLTTAISNFEKDLSKTIKQGESIRESKTWTEDYYNKNFSNTVNEIQSWYREIKAKQDKLSSIQVNIINILGSYFNSRNA